MTPDGYRNALIGGSVFARVITAKVAAAQFGAAVDVAQAQLQARRAAGSAMQVATPDFAVYEVAMPVPAV